MSVTDQHLAGYIEAIFANYDQDHSGGLDARELAKFFNDMFRSMGTQQAVSIEQAQQALAIIDKNHDGRVSKSELFEGFKYILSIQGLNVGGQQMYSNAGQSYSQAFDLWRLAEQQGEKLPYFNTGTQQSLTANNTSVQMSIHQLQQSYLQQQHQIQQQKFYFQQQLQQQQLQQNQQYMNEQLQILRMQEQLIQQQYAQQLQQIQQKQQIDYQNILEQEQRLLAQQQLYAQQNMLKYGQPTLATQYGQPYHYQPQPPQQFHYQYSQVQQPQGNGQYLGQMQGWMGQQYGGQFQNRQFNSHN